MLSTQVSTNADRLLRILLETSFHYNPTPYSLSSGIKSNFYIDCKMALSYPEARELIGELIHERIRREAIEAVGGLALGAYPIAVAVSDAAYRSGSRPVLTAFVVRKEPKSHGLKKHIEGVVRKGDRVLIVDDVVTSGGSTIEAINKSREEGLEVARVITIIDRQEAGGRENIERCGVRFESLFTLRDLLEIYEARNE